MEFYWIFQLVNKTAIFSYYLFFSQIIACIALLGIDEKKIGRNDLKITDIIPNFFDNSKQMASKSGALLEVYTFFQENLVESGLFRFFP